MRNTIYRLKLQCKDCGLCNICPFAESFDTNSPCSWLPNHSTARVVIIDKISNIMGSIGEIIIGYMFYDGLLLIKIIKYFVEHRNTVFIYLMLVLKVKDNREINRRKKMCLINSNMLRFLLNQS